MKNGTFELEGGIDEDVAHSIIILISLCDNKTDGVICKSQEEIDIFFKDKGLWLYYQDDIFDISNYKQPLSKNWKLQTIRTSSTPRILDLYFKKLIFIDDDYFFGSKENISYGFMKDITESSSHFDFLKTPVISVNIFSSKNNQKINRTYQKIEELLANIGGIINVLIIFGFFITNLANQLKMQNHIMNSLYSYSYEPKEKHDACRKGEPFCKCCPFHNQVHCHVGC